MSELQLDHEKLKVYQKSIEFISWAHKILSKNKYRFSIIDQFERSSESIALNIAEGNGKFSGKDRCRYFDIAKGSSLESAACLDVMFSKDLITEETLSEGKRQLIEIISMIMGLIKSNSNRVYEPEASYE